MSTEYHETIKAKSATHQVDIHWHSTRQQYVATLYKRTGKKGLMYIRSVFAPSVDQAFRDLDAGDMEIVTDA